MRANYGYEDASGSFYITIDTHRCDGCGECAAACPMACFAILETDPYDPMREEPVAVVVDEKTRTLKYTCAVCKPTGDPPPPPCVAACPQGAITHSW